ncbi:MAG: hypothetical protein CVU86_06965 [Firmicutes bacterium HGW-Firmicutes-11]|jgi:hypothetical protein|nr:MAG: hypothetical protein CVU94_07930 [Firmicutes bacterium HGW-Firmicutes-19]PKM84465.1 MAG: hypothetical protein CVU86_06965 [Firmicutes bacterium HGW-Firmicutes-11]
MTFKVKRSQFAAFLNTGTLAVPVWSRMGKGITEQSIAYNPNVVTEQFIDEDNATNMLESYAPSISTPQTAYAGNAVFDFVDAMRQNRAIGSSAETEVLLVYLYDSEVIIDVTHYKAEKNACTISIEEFGGAGGESLSITYNIGLNGDPVLGTVTITAGAPTFTAAT